MTDLTVQNGTQMTRATESAAMLDAIIQAAQNPAMDVEKLKSMFELHERMQDRQAAQAYAAAMVAAQAEMRPIAKDRTNSQTKSEYATLEAIDDGIRPVYTKHGFSLSFGTRDSPLPGHVRITCEVTHAEGHSKAFEYDNPMDDKGIQGSVNKTPTHARGSAVTYGRRYLTLLIFNLSTGVRNDDDGNAATSMGSDGADWYTAIADATTIDELNNLANELRNAGLAGATIRNVRAKWAARAKELQA